MQMITKTYIIPNRKKSIITVKNSTFSITISPGVKSSEQTNTLYGSIKRTFGVFR